MGTDGIRFCPDWFWLQFQENVRAKIFPDILFFFFPSISITRYWKLRTYYEIFSQMTYEYEKKSYSFLILLNLIFIILN